MVGDGGEIEIGLVCEEVGCERVIERMLVTRVVVVVVVVMIMMVNT
jgi:hypothetical protein